MRIRKKRQTRTVIKRRIRILVFLTLVVAALSGCRRSAESVDASVNEKPSIVCTIFPQYDWVRQILGDRAGRMELTLLLTDRADLHSFQPTVEDIVTISECDLFIYVGGESDAWITDVLAQAVNPDMKVINLLEVLGESAKTEEVTEGMEEEMHTETEQEETHSEAEDLGGYDEHVWLSLKNAGWLCPAIADALAGLDSDHADQYRNNLSAYMEEIRTLDEAYEAAVQEAPVKTLLFGDRFPFRYLTDDYGIEYFAAFPGCSAETEASFETVIFLAEKTQELDLSAVMVTESADQLLAETIIENTQSQNQRILVLDSLQAVSSEAIDKGASYLSIMGDNLVILQEALRPINE